MDDLDQYDEFGNYIGPERTVHVEKSHGVDSHEEKEDIESNGIGFIVVAVGGLARSSGHMIVFPEEKEYYPSAESVYGKEVDIRVEEEDTQPLTQPIIVPVKEEIFLVSSSLGNEVLPSAFSNEYLNTLMGFGERIRNVVIGGHIHHGKTTFLDMLVHESHPLLKMPHPDAPLRVTDMKIMSRQRGIGLQSQPLTLVLGNTKGRGYLFNFIDTPGHVDFEDEVLSGTSVTDGAILIVDAAEGVMCRTESLLRLFVTQGHPIVLVLNKMDRLVLELRLPPSDAYHKLKHTIDELNTLLASLGVDESRFFCPRKGNVIFSSGKYQWIFSLESMGNLYVDHYFENTDSHLFAEQLWGDRYYDESSGSICMVGDGKMYAPEDRSFVKFILEPLYKIHIQVLCGEKGLQESLKSIGIALKKSDIDIDSRVTLRRILSLYFDGTGVSALSDTLEKFLPSPLVAASTRVPLMYTGDIDDEKAECMMRCDPKGPLMVFVSKLLPCADARSFLALGKIMSGTLRSGSRINVLGEHFLPDIDEEDCCEHGVSGIFVALPLHNMPIGSVGAGNVVLISGIDSSILKTATLVEDGCKSFVFRRLVFATVPVVKVSIEPVHPSELPKMLDGLRCVSKVYPMAETRVEESGEHVLFGSGEMYLDCILHDLRTMYSRIDIKVSDPSVRFCETVVETSSMQCVAQTPNQRYRIGVRNFV